MGENIHNLSTFPVPHRKNYEIFWSGKERCLTLWPKKNNYTIIAHRRNPSSPIWNRENIDSTTPH